MLYSPVATLTSVEDDRMLVASRRWRPVFLIFGGQMRAFTVPTRPLGSSRTTPKRVSRPLFPLCNRSPRPTHLLGSSFLPAGMPPSPVPGAARPDSVRTQHDAVHGRGSVYTRISLERTHKPRLPPYRKIAEQEKQTYTMWPSLRSITFLPVLLWVHRAQTWMVVTVRVRSPRIDAISAS